MLLRQTTAMLLFATFWVHVHFSINCLWGRDKVDGFYQWSAPTCHPRMAMDSDLLGQGMCSRWRKGEAPAGDFQWASHFKVVPQQVGN